jgi:glucokinase
MGVANVIHAYAPIVVYIGGAVALKNPDLVVEPIRERVEEMVMINVPDIQLTSLGDEVVVKGAVASAMTGGTGDRARL